MCVRTSVCKLWFWAMVFALGALQVLTVLPLKRGHMCCRGRWQLATLSCYRPPIWTVFISLEDTVPLAVIHKVVSVAEAAPVVVARHGMRHGRKDVELWLLAQCTGAKGKCLAKLPYNGGAKIAGGHAVYPCVCVRGGGATPSMAMGP